ncbi:MAG: helix-turn-helix transcriptional regulator [Lachnospiraceae bacterium]|nr:helix-turn-helix transcriptional regulator [Lachnospiraceae bacterium]
MAFGKRIRLFRTRKRLLQKQLGELLGFQGKTTEVRIAQYENESRTPKEDLVKQMASVLDVSPYAINVPEIDTYVGLMHTLFALEDMYGFKAGVIDGEYCIRLDREHSCYLAMFDMVKIWADMAQKVHDEKITKDDYDSWRYNYPANTPGWVKTDLDDSL